jgi:hypothetical protein
MTDRVIFAFWEPRNKIIPYLELCLKTWEKNLRDYSIVILDHSNLEDYIPAGTFDLAQVRQLRLSTQKNAISVAVLKEHGGVFMDVDTLVFQDLSPILRRLESTQLVMFGSHLAFLAARPNSYVMALWLKGIQRKLARIAAENIPMAGLPWDYIGNRTLTEVKDEIINSSSFNRMQTKAVDELTRLANSLPALGPGSKRLLNRAHNSVLGRRSTLAFDTVYRKYLTVLDRKKQGFILEARHYESWHRIFQARGFGHEERYVKYWFENDADVDTVIETRPIIVGLHNSWTPQWYKELSEKNVLENDCLLSRTIHYILAR